MLTRIKKYFNEKMFHDETGRILNYVTLQITDPEVAKDLNNHKFQ